MLTVWLVTAYSVAAYGSTPVSIAGLVIVAAMSVVRSALDPGIEWEPLSSLFVLIPWGAGLAIRRHRRQAAELRKLTHELASEREERAHAAVVEERTRIARELHDVVAHSVSVIAVQAAGRSSARPRPGSLAGASRRDQAHGPRGAGGDAPPAWDSPGSGGRGRPRTTAWDA